MKKLLPLFLLLVTFGVMSSSPAFSQVKCNLLQANNAAGLCGLGFYSIYKASKGA